MYGIFTYIYYLYHKNPPDVGISYYAIHGSYGNVMQSSCFSIHTYRTDMDVSENSGTPKSSILIGCSIINHPFWGTPIVGKAHMESSKCRFWVIRCYTVFFQQFLKLVALSSQDAICAKGRWPMAVKGIPVCYDPMQENTPENQHGVCQISQNDAFGKGKMAIFGIYVRYLGCKSM